jgi:hypothetical protein
MERPMTTVRSSAVLVLAALVLAAGPAAAQTSDDLFNPEVLQRIELWMN